MHRWMRKALSCGLLLSAVGAMTGASAETVTELWFEEFEPGAGSWRSRALVSEHWLRWDEGNQANDFLLFDRRSGSLYSIREEDQSLLEIPRAAAIPEAPATLDLQRESLSMEAPQVAGKSVMSYQVRAGGEICGGFSAAVDLLPMAAAALREYQLAVAANNHAQLAVTPVDLRSPCFLANNIHAVALRHADGFPVAEWRLDDGRRRLLVDFREGVEVKAGLFELPDYRRFGLPTAGAAGE